MKPLAIVLLVGVVSLPGITEAADLLCRTPLEIRIGAAGDALPLGGSRVVTAFFQTPAKAGKKGELLNQGECAFETSPSGTNHRVLVAPFDIKRPDRAPKTAGVDWSRPQTGVHYAALQAGHCAVLAQWMVERLRYDSVDHRLLDTLLERDLLVRFTGQEMRLTRWNAPNLGESDSTKEKTDFEKIRRVPTPTPIPGSDRAFDGTKGTDVFRFKQPAAAVPR